MPRALCLIRKEPHYRHDAFVAGLEAAGYEVVTATPTTIKPDDIVLSWNRYGVSERICEQFEAAGARACIAENGYLNPGGCNPKFDAHEGKPGYYALAMHGHNGSGWFPSGGPERWDALGIELKPWRTDGEHILIAPNRDFGSKVMAPPPNWAEQCAEKWRRHQSRPVRVRPHPGNKRPERTLEQDLEGAHLCVIWASSAGLTALINGIEVICEAHYWICKDAFDDATRLAAFRRLAWAQFTVDEIASGFAFDHLLRRADQEKIAARA